MEIVIYSKTKDCGPEAKMRYLISSTKAMETFFHSLHHAVSGASFLSDHEQFGDIYEMLSGKFDEFVERFIGVFGDKRYADPIRVTKDSLSYLQAFYNTNKIPEDFIYTCKGDDFAYVAYTALCCYYDCVNSTYLFLNGNELLTLGMDDLIMSFLSELETHKYKLMMRVS